MDLINILLVEDNPGDVRLTKEAMKESKIVTNLMVVTDGEEALDFLMKKSKFANAITPDLILLDLNLPKKSGLDVLAEIKGHDKLKVIPVVVLTTSQAEKDIMLSYEHYVNCYVSKPVSFDAFIEVVKSIEDFWFTLVKLPKINA